MTRFAAVSLLLAVAFVAAVADVDPAANYGGSFDPNAESKLFIQRRLLEDAAGADDAAIYGPNGMLIQRRLLSGEDACQMTCEKVRFRSLCRSLTRLPGVKTPHELLLAAMQVAIKKTKMTKARLDAYAASAHAVNPMASILETCSKGYDDSLTELLEVQKVAVARSAPYDELNRKITDAFTSTTDCDTAFEERPEIKSPIAEEQKNLFRVVENVMAIAGELKQQY
ncbi:hypothetical protein ACP70R_040554 [Stipagrostis hirtigluma subsp. patula]